MLSYQIKTTGSNPRFYYLKDHLGNIRVRVNSTGTRVSYDDYYPFGSISRSFNASVDNRYRFTGKERDTETGYDYFGARYYDSRIGRWLQVDPKTNDLPDLTPYNYTRNNPLLRIDPDGKKDFKVTMRTYIPFKLVGPFRGDNRGPQYSGGTFRTEQIARIETNPSVSSNPLISKQNATGTTKTIIQNIDGVPLGAKLPEFKAGFKTNVTRSAGINNGDNATVNFSASAANPLVQMDASAIDYNLSISINPGQNGDIITVDGAHDGFPAYEVWVESEGEKPRLIYNHSPNSALDALKLFGEKEVKVGE